MRNMVKKPCGCPGPLCGQMGYAEMETKLVEKYNTFGQGPSDLRTLHRKWKKLAAEV